jgi:serine/threonine protein kinase
MSEFWVGPTDAPDTYRLVSLIGGGGEGEVWKAVLRLSADGQRQVAVKMCPARDDADQFQNFGHLLRSLAHPGLVRVTDVFRGPVKHRRAEATASPEDQAAVEYVIMDHVQGTNLREWVADHPHATVSERLRLLGMVAAALDEMHSGSMTDVAVAHGDVKPSNIVVRPDGSAVLVDLGLSCLEDADGRRGRSVAYAAPELRKPGSRATPAADRYAFAVTTAHLLTGEPPPLDDSAELDVGALRRQLATNPLTARRHTLADRIATMIDAEPEARTRSLRPWLDSTIDSLSQITDGDPDNARQPAAAAESPTGVNQVGNSSTGPSLTWPGWAGGGSPSAAPGVPSPQPPHTQETPTITAQGFCQHSVPPASTSSRSGFTRFRPQYHQQPIGESGTMHPDYPHDVEPHPPPGRPRPKYLYGIIAAVVVALVVGGVVIIPKFMHSSQSEIFAAPATSAGDNPFARGLALPQAPPVSPVNTPPTSTGATPSVSGSTPGLYAGVQGSPAYDTTELASQVQSDPQKATAFSTGVNTQPSNIGSFLSGLQAVYLTGTIRVTYYTYVNGTLVGIQAVLQPTTLVLVDKFGNPVVRIIGGNPLGAPTPVVGTPVYVGQLWPGFNLNSVVVITPASQPLAMLTVYDPVTGQLFNLPLGVYAQVVPLQQAQLATPPPPAQVPVWHPQVPVWHPAAPRQPQRPACGNDQWRDSDGDCHDKERPRPRCDDGEHIRNGECVENKPPRIEADPPPDKPPAVSTPTGCRPGIMVSDGECGSNNGNNNNGNNNANNSIKNCNKSCGRRDSGNNTPTAGAGGCFAIVNGRNQGVPCHH